MSQKRAVERRISSRCRSSFFLRRTRSSAKTRAPASRINYMSRAISNRAMRTAWASRSLHDFAAPAKIEHIISHEKGLHARGIPSRDVDVLNRYTGRNTNLDCPEIPTAVQLAFFPRISGR